MQDEISGKTVMLAVNTTKFTAGVLEQMIKSYLAAHKQKKHLPKQVLLLLLINPSIRL